MVKRQSDIIIDQREDILLRSCKEIAVEIKEIDPAFFDVFLRLGQLPLIHDEITAILDNHFKCNSMVFSCTGESHIRWDSNPIVGLDFEFTFDGIFAFFRLVLCAENIAIQLHHISFEKSAGSPQRNTVHLSRALKQSQQFKSDGR